MTHVAWRQSGLPPTHVIGAGCNLDSERLSYVLDIHLNTHKPAWVIGELSDNKGETKKTKPDSLTVYMCNIVEYSFIYYTNAATDTEED